MQYREKCFTKMYYIWVVNPTIMKKNIFILIVLLSSISVLGQKVIFLHHSTGDGVYYEGNVSQWISNYNAQHSTNYQVSERMYPNTPYPWANYPYDYWYLWINNHCNNSDPDIECMSKLAQDYDVIIFKHCFPGASIEADNGNPSVSSEIKTLANYKLQYRALRTLMDSYPNKKFIVWTLAPLHRLITNVDEASRAKQFVDWVKTSWLTEDGKSHPNIYIFDFFGYAAESNPTPLHGQLNCLKYDYEKNHSDSDSHPNLLANQTIGPIFAQFIVNTIQNTSSKVDMIKNSNYFKIYPNPASDEVVVDLLGIVNENVSVDFYDLYGKLTYHELVYNQPKIRINTSSLNEGVYIINFITEGSIYRKKLVIIKDY